LPDDPQAFITAQDNSIAAKWWQEGCSRETNFPDLFYTSAGDDPRLHTPARFILVCNGKANQATPITINVKWDVTLSEPSLELAGVEETLTAAIPIGMATDGKLRDWSVSTKPVAGFNTVFPGATASAVQGLNNGEFLLDSGVWRYTRVEGTGSTADVFPIRYFAVSAGDIVGLYSTVDSTGGGPILAQLAFDIKPFDNSLAPWFFAGKNFTAVSALKAAATTVDFLLRR